MTGTKTFTYPSATTALGSAFVLKLEENDSAIQDILQINVGTAGSAGAASIYGFEPYACGGHNGAGNNQPWLRDTTLGPYSIPNIAAGTATSGTATSFLGFLGAQQASTFQMTGYITAFTE